MQPDQKDQETFEETYPRYPFAELVRLGILLGRWLARARLVLGARRRDLETRERPERRRLSSL